MSRDVDGDDTFGVASLLAAVAAPKVGDRTKALDRLCAWLDNAGNRALLDNAGGSEVRPGLVFCVLGRFVRPPLLLRCPRFRVL